MQWFLQDISIGENLKALRERSGYSLKQIYGVDYSGFFVGLLPDKG